MLQSMRSSAKYIFWILLIAFVGWLALDTSGVLGTGTGVTPGTTVAEVNGVMAASGWKPGKHMTGDLPPAAPPPGPDSLGKRLGRRPLTSRQRVHTIPALSEAHVHGEG